MLQNYRLPIYILLAIPLLTGFARPDRATNPAPVGTIQIARRVVFEPPKGQPAPKRTAGGGRRDNGACSTEEASAQRTWDKLLTALVPENKLGLTTNAYPTFFAYVPKTSAQSVEFLIEDSNGEDFYQKTVPLTSTPAVIRLTLPETVSHLEVGKDYRWIVSINCQPKGPQDPFVEAWIRRVNLAPTISNQISKAKPLDRASIYATAGIWHDSLMILASLRQENQTDQSYTTAWKDLLQSVRLEAIVAAPLQKSP